MIIHIVSAGRNHAAFTEASVRSVIEQDVPEGVEIWYTWIDDASDGPTWPESVRASRKGILLHRRRNKVRMGGVANAWEYERASQADVVFRLGGDDALLPGAVVRLAEMFADPECWVAYGSYVSSDPVAHPPRARPFDNDDWRNHPFVFMPLAFRPTLFRKIHRCDLEMGGVWQPSSGDVALTLPMLEMAGRSRVRFNEQPLMRYTVHPHNDATQDRVLQDFCWWYSRARPRYSTLGALSDTPTVDRANPRSPVKDAIQFLPWTEHPSFGPGGRTGEVLVTREGLVIPKGVR